MTRIAILLAAAALPLIAAGARAADERPSVTVVGEASEEVRPDVAWLSLTIRDQKSTAAEAANDNARRAEVAIAALTAAGVAAKDIATAGLTLNPVWSQSAGPRGVTAYEATNRLSVRVQPVDKTGAVIAQAVLAGAEYQGLEFDLSDREAREDGLRGKAVENAAHRAELYARGAAMKLGPLQSIRADAAQPAFRPLMETARAIPASGAPAPPPIEPGQIKLSDSITATWTLAPN